MGIVRSHDALFCNPTCQSLVVKDFIKIDHGHESAEVVYLGLPVQVRNICVQLLPVREGLIRERVTIKEKFSLHSHFRCHDIINNP